MGHTEMTPPPPSPPVVVPFYQDFIDPDEARRIRENKEWKRSDPAEDVRSFVPYIYPFFQAAIAQQGLFISY